MIVVADSGPLHYLILLGQGDLLPRLYGRILIPPGVVRELSATGAPLAVAEWLARPPSWLSIEKVIDRRDRIFEGALDVGESEVIALASAVDARLVLLDDLAARREARRRSLRVVGTLGILRAAAELDLIAVPDVVKRLRATNFYLDEDLIQTVFSKWL